VLVNRATAEFLGPERVDSLGECARAIYREQLRRHAKAVFVDKTPRYYQCLDFIRACLPEARYIWIRRNPLDVAASYKATWGVDLVALTREPADDPYLFDFALGFRRLADFADANVVCSVIYEGLVADPRSEMNRVFRHLDLPPLDIDTRMDASASAHERSAFGDRKIVATREIHRNSVDTWRDVLSADEVAAVLSALGRELFARLGYAGQFDAAAASLSRSVEDRSSELEAAARRFLAERSDSAASEPYRSAVERTELRRDREAKDALIRSLSDRIEAVESDRAAKDEVIARLVAQLEAVENDRRLKDEVIDRLGSELRMIEADRQAKDALIRQSSEQLRTEQRALAEKEEASRGLAADLSAAQAEIHRLNERPLARLRRFVRSRIYAR
jgi:hypothetical protein